MNDAELLLAVSGLFVTSLLALWSIIERKTTRLINSFEKCMNESEEKLLAKIDDVATHFDAIERQLDDF